MTTPTSQTGAALRTLAPIPAEYNLIPPSLQSALAAPPRVSSKPVTAEMLTAAALRALLALSAPPVASANGEVGNTRNPSAPTTTTTTTSSTTVTTTTTTTTTTTVAVNASAHTGNSNSSLVAAMEEGPYRLLPLEKRFEVFGWAADLHEGRNSSLLSLAKASKGSRREVITYLNVDRKGREFRDALRKGELPRWKANADELARNAETLRQSARQIDLNRMTPGDVAALDPSQNLPKHGVIKITAAGIGRDRVLAELPGLLARVPSYGKVALDVSDNSLTAQDLEVLSQSLERKPVVYQLSLDNNPICQGDEVCKPIVELLSQSGPTSHVYLRNIGLNDATAAGFQPALATSPVLQHLDLRNNRLSRAGALAIVGGIVPSTNVRSLRLQGNSFGMDWQVGEAVNRAHVTIKIERAVAHGGYDPTLQRDEVYIAEIDGVRAAWFESSAVQQVFQRKFEEAALAQRI